jgi:ATP-dependent Clp protease ATP-binding subunit ClpA
MNTDLFTEKAREAIVAAEQLAEERRNSQLEPVHLLLAPAATKRLAEVVALTLTVPAPLV